MVSSTLTHAMRCRYLPAVGRFLIVVTFLEDTLRIITQWSEQLTYLNEYRNSRCPVLWSFHRAPPTSCALTADLDGLMLQFRVASRICFSSRTSSPCSCAPPS